MRDFEKEYWEAQVHIDSLEAENKALREFATHIPGCHEEPNDCICGLDALLAKEETKP